MELNVLLLPLLGGFLFVSIFRPTKYLLAREPAASVSFWIATAGLSVLLLARLALMACQATTSRPAGLVAFWIAAIALPTFLVLAIIGLTLYAFLPKPARSRQWRVYAAGLPVLALIAVVRFLNLDGGRRLGHSWLPEALWILLASFLLLATAKWAQRVKVLGPKMVVRVAATGIGLAVLAIAITLYPDKAKAWWVGLSAPAHSVEPEVLGTSLLACVLGPILALLLNIFYPRHALIGRLFRKKAANSLDRLLYGATQRGKMVMLSLDDRKVYCGYVEWIPGNPSAPDAFLEIIPLFSGYRETENKRVHLPISYVQIYKDLKEHDDLSQFKKVIPIARIVTAGEYEPEYFNAFNDRTTALASVAPPVPSAQTIPMV
jgi:hypothetical protein